LHHLLMLLLQECGGRNLPFRLELDELAAAMPVGDGLGYELSPRTVALLELDGDAPRLDQDGLERHFEGGPFRIGKALEKSRVVIEPADAIALQQRRLRLGLASEGDDLRAVLFRHGLVVPGALD